MGTYLAYGIKNPLSIKKASTLRSYPDGKKQLLPKGGRIEHNPVPGIRIKCADRNALE
jgi:hypothetical protein